MTMFNRRSFFTILSSTLSGAAWSSAGLGQSSSSVKQQADFDYIVVGSGAGGGPLAVNLAKAGFKTLLLEAGTDQGKRDVYQVPAFHTQSTEDSEMAWDFYVDHFKKAEDNQADSKHVPGKGILYPRAGTVGGCTAHNAMITVYPLRKDWDQMGEDVGDSTFNGAVMRKYFQLCENAQYTQLPERKKGWLPVNIASPLLVLDDKAIKAQLFSAWRAFRKSGSSDTSAIQSVVDLVFNADTNVDTEARDSTEGLVMIPTATTAGGKRFSTRDLILSQVGKNLTLRTSALVTKVLFDEGSDTPEATGVEYIIGDKVYKASKGANPASTKRFQVYAKHDVILAAGAFNTPQLLMASGIGPKADLDFFAATNPDYKVRVDLPGVGANLQDRYEVAVVTKTKEPVQIVAECDFKASLSDPCYSFWKQGNGPYTSNGGVIGMFKKSSPELSHPDLFMFLLPTDFHGYFPGYSQTVAAAKDSMTWAILKTHTQNRGGRVRLTSLDPTSVPKINFNYYEDGTDAEGNAIGGNKFAVNPDLEAVVTGVEFVREITDGASTIIGITDIFGDTPETPRELLHPYFEEVIPGPKVAGRSKVREWVRRNSWGHHACGTCKMGQTSDPMTVVDSKFNVIGTRGLRIVDASVFPRIPGYFIASSIYTLSERASDEILAVHGIPRRVEV